MLRRAFTNFVRDNKLLYDIAKAILGNKRAPFRQRAYLCYPVNLIPRYGYGKPAHEYLLQIIDRRRDTYKQVAASFLQFEKKFLSIPLRHDKGRVIEPFWINGLLPALDSVSIYSFLALNNPRRYFEIGSGNSTKFARKAINDYGLLTKIKCIEPYPIKELSLVCDELIHSTLENIDIDVFSELENGDILFVDCSHYVFMNSDATVFFLDILPRLKPGVLVGVHDIYLPYDYVAKGSIQYYSEQYLLAAYLLAESDKFEIIFPSMFFCKDKELNSVLSPLWDSPLMGEAYQDNPVGYTFWIKTKNAALTR